MTLYRTDHSRPIDPVIDYFGEARPVPVSASPLALRRGESARREVHR